MGEAKRRGTREERVAAAQPKVAKTPTYVPRIIYRTKMMDFLWTNFKVFGDVTVGEIRAQAVATQQRMAAERAAKEEQNVTIDIEQTPFRTGGVIETSDQAVPDRVAPESGSPVTGGAAA